jgi:RNA-directed DNA polymerase
MEELASSPYLLVHSSPKEGRHDVRHGAWRWSQRLGAALKPSQTRIAQTQHPVEGVAGFDFLGFHIRQDPVSTYKTGTTGQGKPLGFKPHIKPSPEAQRTHLQQIKEERRPLRAASQAPLIRRLNPLLWGWRHYYSAVVAKATLSRMDTLVCAKPRRWAPRRHPKKSPWWVRAQSWHRREGHWTFTTEKGNTLRRHADISIRRHTKVTGARSPYDGD